MQLMRPRGKEILKLCRVNFSGDSAPSFLCFVRKGWYHEVFQ
jgi:hypothetical protein